MDEIPRCILEKSKQCMAANNLFWQGYDVYGTGAEGVLEKDIDRVEQCSRRSRVASWMWRLEHDEQSLVRWVSDSRPELLVGHSERRHIRS